ncbi:MAG: arginine--tRNA ligase [Solirubrobacterales bacterium]
MATGTEQVARTDPLADLRQTVIGAAAEVAGMDTPPGGVVLERTRKAAHGDFATNAAMVCAPIARDNPRNVAAKLAEKLAGLLGDDLVSAEVAGPGFLNLTLSDGWYARTIAAVLDPATPFGSGSAAVVERINVEFVSANPTGPMHLGHGRNAAYGDALCRVLEYAGHQVGREFYINDFGSQVTRFGASIAARARGEDPPEDGYQGVYIERIADAIPGAADLGSQALADRGIELMIEQIGATLADMRVEIEIWFSERELHADDRFERAIAKLREAGHVYDHEEAVWLRTTTFGDDKDRVLRRSNGEYTYFATDIAYHADKLARGYGRLIDVLGADHHGYIARMSAALQSLGGEPDAFEPIIMQLVNLTETGVRVQMSKRTGEFVTVDELLEDIGADALRFFMVQRSHDTTMDLDVALARDQSDKNPVYYVQYAHARICSILTKAGGAETGTAVATHELHASERALVRLLSEFPDEIAETALRRAPHRLTIYSRELAAGFSAFYRDCQVVGDDESVQAFRVALCEATRQTLARSLDLLGVTAPERMDRADLDAGVTDGSEVES